MGCSGDSESIRSQDLKIRGEGVSALSEDMGKSGQKEVLLDATPQKACSGRKEAGIRMASWPPSDLDALQSPVDPLLLASH